MPAYLIKYIVDIKGEGQDKNSTEKELTKEIKEALGGVIVEKLEVYQTSPWYNKEKECPIEGCHNYRHDYLSPFCAFHLLCPKCGCSSDAYFRMYMSLDVLVTCDLEFFYLYGNDPGRCMRCDTIFDDLEQLLKDIADYWEKIGEGKNG